LGVAPRTDDLKQQHRFLDGDSRLLEFSAVCLGTLVVLGVLNSIANQCLVTAGVPSSDLTAELTLVDYVPAVYEAELATMPAFVSG
jgi:hypothetical protein